MGSFARKRRPAYRVMAPFSLGTIVHDREDSTPDDVVVIHTPDTTASEWYVPGRGTLAADNPTYPDDDPVVVVMYRETLAEARPQYAGHDPLELSQLSEDHVPFYAFPASRLEAVGELSFPHKPVSILRPSPLHVRSFGAAANQEFITAILERGTLRRPPLVRPASEGTFEIIDGHKRVWASAVADLETTLVCIRDLDDRTAAKRTIEAHRDEYTPTQRSIVRDRLEAWIGAEAVEEFLSPPAPA